MTDGGKLSGRHPSTRIITGRARPVWGSSRQYDRITPERVTYPGGVSTTPVLANEAVHPRREASGPPLVYHRRSTTASTGNPGVGPSADTQLRGGAHAPAGRSRSLTRPGGWTASACLIAAIVCLPILSVLYLALNPGENIWPHLVRTVLGSYVLNTLGLMLGVALGTALLGISTAWFVTHYEFPGRRLFNWALLLPFAVPAYVLAYVYTDLLEYAGPVQQALRALFGWRLANEYWFPSIRSLPGAIAMLVLVLYPYVYLLARAAFLEQSASILEAARALGGNANQRFFRVALPMARPAIVVGLAMALMETLNDYGTVDYFAVRTLTAGIYDVWLRMNNLGGGAQIASLLLGFVMILLALEKISRRHQQNYQPSATRFRRLHRRVLTGWRCALVVSACALPVILGFLVPGIVLLRYAINHFDSSFNAAFRVIALNSVLLSLMAAVAAVSIGLLLSYSRRLHPTRTLRASISLASMGYAVPGAVLAIGVIIPFAAFDNGLDALARRYLGVSTGLLLSGTVFALVFAYTVRFLAVAFGSVDASMRKISPHMDDAARSLGQSSFGILHRVHVPLMRSGILTAALVVFVDCMKELPATLVLRPFNFDTLATHVYQFASDELIGKAALGSLLIVAAGLLPVILLTITIDRSRELKATGLVGTAVINPTPINTPPARQRG